MPLRWDNASQREVAVLPCLRVEQQAEAEGGGTGAEKAGDGGTMSRLIHLESETMVGGRRIICPRIYERVDSVPVSRIDEVTCKECLAFVVEKMEAGRKRREMMMRVRG